jgi:uncharacterized damage-inducible protein DinB
LPYSLTTHLDYSLWANRRLAETLAPVSEALFGQVIVSSFPSLKKTVLHIWDAEQIWLNRLKGVSLAAFPSESFRGDKEAVIGGMLKTSAELSEFVAGQPKEFLRSTIRYTNLKGEPFENVAEDLLYHVVNHGSYHRGQATTMLRQLGVRNILSMDIIFYLRDRK